ncbi:MAG TPA: hypothetical protein VN370_08235 [Desulfitobacteriaceae bacterium]|nr:hypothetical protein [Desulfitobacteriaceae bacterium]
MLKSITKVFAESSVLGWVLAGTAAIVLAPTVTNLVRGVAVGTAKGILSLAEGGSSLAGNVKHGWESIVAEAKAQKGAQALDPNTTLGIGTGGALGATVGGMAGPIGAAVGGGLGGIVGAGVGSEIAHDSKHESKKEEHKDENKASKY